MPEIADMVSMTDLDAQGLQVHCALQLTDAPGGGQERLGGNAATVDAGPADVMPLNDCGLQALSSESTGGVSKIITVHRGREYVHGCWLSHEVFVHQ